MLHKKAPIEELFQFYKRLTTFWAADDLNFHAAILLSATARFLLSAYTQPFHTLAHETSSHVPISIYRWA